MRYTITFLAATLIGTSAMAEVPRVVTDFGPIQSLVIQVMGDLGTPDVLLPAGGDPHDFQMKPSQAQALADADLIFWDGPELMPALGDAIATLGENGKAIDLLRDGGGKTRMFDGDEGMDPHAWLDPTNAHAWLATIAAELSAKDPGNAARYTANAAAAQSAIAAMDAEVAAQLAPVKDKPFVVFHDALGYFADHYDLQVAGAIELSDASDPSASQLTEIQTLLRDKQAVCVFPEAGRDPALVAAVVEGTDARIGEGQDVEALTIDAGPAQYDLLIRGLAKTLVDCLGAAD